MSHLPLDARAILHYLNELGFRNISAIQLKEFLKDLRKLIKYDERMGVNTHQNDYYDGLFRRTTASYRAKIGKENVEKYTNLDSEKPATSKQAGNRNMKVLFERNHVTAISSSGSSSENQNKLTAKEHQHQRNCNVKADKADKSEFDIRIIKDLIEKELAHVLSEKFQHRSTERSTSEEKTAIKSIVEEVLKEKLIDLRHPSKERVNTTQPGSLRSIIEDVVEEVLMEKLKSLEKYHNDESMEGLEKELQQKLNLGNGTQTTQQREPLVQHDVNRSFDSQALVEEILGSDEARNNSDKLKTTCDKETATKPGLGIKRLQRSPKRKIEWQNPSQHDNVSHNPQRPQYSPVPTSTARSRRSKCSSSVLIPRSVSQGRRKKPQSDPVALYQYYKKEWEHFRKQIPGETSHSDLRWQVRHRFLDPE